MHLMLIPRVLNCTSRERAPVFTPMCAICVAETLINKPAHNVGMCSIALLKQRKVHFTRVSGEAYQLKWSFLHLWSPYEIISIPLEIFSRTKGAGILQAQPGVIHFDGYRVGESHQQTVVSACHGSHGVLTRPRLYGRSRVRLLEKNLSP